MNYLIYSKLTALLERSPELFAPRERRLVGVDRAFDSGFYGIVRFYGPDAVDPSRVAITVLPGRYEIGDPIIQHYAQYVAERLRRQGRLYDGPTVTGVVSAVLTGESAEVVVQETAYRDFAGSCFALDMPHPLFSRHGGTLRDYYVRTYAKTSVDSRPLANCLGVCGYLMIDEGSRRFLLQIVRAGHLATMAGSPGPSVAGSVDFKPDYSSIADIVARALGQEVEEELRLVRGEFEIVPLAFARELFRGDNPQLFALVRTGLSRQQLAARLSAIPDDEREFADFRFIELSGDGRMSGDRIDSVNFEAKMSYFLAEEYLHSVR